MSRFKTSGWTHFNTMDALLLGNFAWGSCAYHLAATGTTAPSASTNISSAPAASDISISSSVSHLSPSIPLSGTGSVPGISVGSGIPNFPPLNYTGPYYGSSSSHTSSNPIMMPPAQLCYLTPFIGSATGTVTQGGMTEKAFPHSINLQPQVFSVQFGSPHSSVPPPSLYHQSSHDSGALSMAGSTQSKKCSLAEVGMSKAVGQGLLAGAFLLPLLLDLPCCCWVNLGSTCLCFTVLSLFAWEALLPLPCDVPFCSKERVAAFTMPLGFRVLISLGEVWERI